MGICSKTKVLEQEQVFQDQLLSKMSKTMDLVARLDAYNTGDNQTRVSKLLGYLYSFHMSNSFWVPTALFCQTYASVASGAWKPSRKRWMPRRWPTMSWQLLAWSQTKPTHVPQSTLPQYQLTYYWGNLTNQ